MTQKSNANVSLLSDTTSQWRGHEGLKMGRRRSFVGLPMNDFMGWNPAVRPIANQWLRRVIPDLQT
jgi:hypothetical protein